MKKIAWLLLIIAFSGCQNEDEPIARVPQPLSVNYSFQNMFYPAAPVGADNQVTVKFLDDIIVKRTGGLRPMDPATGFNFAYDAACYDKVSYSGYRITLEEGMIQPYYSEPNAITVFLIGINNRITHKININGDGFQTPGDTLKYQYDGLGLLIGSTQKFNSTLRETATYYYNPAKNLDSIVTQKFYQNTLENRIVEKFTEYDHAPNPLRKLFIFKETFLRSLSTNNFMKYEKVFYNANNELEGSEERVWNIPHDANGNIIF